MKCQFLNLLWAFAWALPIACQAPRATDDSSDTGDTNETGGIGIEAGIDEEDTSSTELDDGELFRITASLSPAIGTVAVVEWTVDMPVDAAYIEFGRDPDDFEYRAPVPSVSVTENRTLLLGMKPNTTYAYRIVASSAGREVISDLNEITTGPMRNGLPVVEVDTWQPDALEGGFTIACFYGQDPWTFILDRDGDYVWWYQATGMNSCSRARMSYDGQHIWIGNLNLTGSDGAVLRVSMDGRDDQVFSLPHRHHDFAVLPDERLVLIEYKPDTQLLGDIVTLFDPKDLQTRQIFDLATADPGAAP